jgi:hypothetical protein
MEGIIENYTRTTMLNTNNIIVFITRLNIQFVTLILEPLDIFKSFFFIDFKTRAISSYSPLNTSYIFHPILQCFLPSYAIVPLFILV